MTQMALVIDLNDGDHRGRQRGDRPDQPVDLHDGFVRRNPHQQPALAAGGDGHVPVDQEGEATEHPFLVDATLGLGGHAEAIFDGSCPS